MVRNREEEIAVHIGTRWEAERRVHFPSMSIVLMNLSDKYGRIIRERIHARTCSIGPMVLGSEWETEYENESD